MDFQKTEVSFQVGALMIDKPGSRHFIDPEQELLRENLAIAVEFLANKHMHQLYRIYAKNASDDAKAIDNFRKSVANFVARKSHRQTFDYFRPLSEALIGTPLIRGLRFLKTGRPSALDNLVSVLTDERGNYPKDVDFGGRYFVYYGSYVSASHYSIRTIEITSDKDGFYKVTDDINDWLKFGGSLLHSSGVLTFFEGGVPQIILVPGGNETKVGFTFMTGVKPLIANEGRLHAMCGIFSTLMVKNEVAIRCFSMVRETILSKEQMIAVSKAHTRDDLAKPEMSQHREAFDMLSKRMPNMIPDPMFTYASG